MASHQASEDLKVHTGSRNLRTIRSKRSPAKVRWTEQLEIARLKREMFKLEAERDILKKPRRGRPLRSNPRNRFSFTGFLVSRSTRGGGPMSRTDYAKEIMLWTGRAWRWSAGTRLVGFGRHLRNAR
jgi:hypothetical protein